MRTQRSALISWQNRPMFISKQDDESFVNPLTGIYVYTRVSTKTHAQFQYPPFVRAYRTFLECFSIFTYRWKMKSSRMNSRRRSILISFRRFLFKEVTIRFSIKSKNREPCTFIVYIRRYVTSRVTQCTHIHVLMIKYFNYPCATNTFEPTMRYNFSNGIS